MESRQKQAFAVVWTHLPLVTLLCPCLGHVGIAGSSGETHDFGGSRYISLSRMTFGNPLKYVPLQIEGSEAAAAFDSAIQAADSAFTHREHQFLSNNCHHHVAMVLTMANYQHKEWTAAQVWWLLLRRGKFMTCWARCKTYGLCCVIGLALCLLALLALP